MMAGMTCQMFAGYFVDILLVWNSVVNLAGGTSLHEGVSNDAMLKGSLK